MLFCRAINTQRLAGLKKHEVYESFKVAKQEKSLTVAAEGAPWEIVTFFRA